MSDAGALVGIDAGGTKVSGLVLAGGEIVGGCRLDTDVSSQEAVVGGIERIFAALSGSAASRGLEVAGVGLGIAGYIDFRRGVVTESPNLPLRDLPLRDLLRERLGLPVVLDNDANLAALAENRLGAGGGCSHQVHLTLGTGIGGGLIIDGRVYRGATGTAAELGHLIILEGGPLANCGHRGCLEALASGTAVEREARSRCAGGWEPDAGEPCGPEGVTARHVTRAALRGDPTALEIWRDMGRHLGVGIAALLNAFNPERLTLSGGLLGAWDFFRMSMFAALEENAIPLSLRAAQVLRTALGDEAGALGAALLAAETRP